VKIRILQLNLRIGAFEPNRQKLLAAYEQAIKQGAEFVIAPELFLCGYPPRELLLRQDFIEANFIALHKTAAAVGEVPLCVGFVDENPARPARSLFNSAAILQAGKVLWQQPKSLLPTYAVFDENRYFEPAKPTAPLELNGRKLGITICDDIWNVEDFWSDRLCRRDSIKELIVQGANIIPTGSITKPPSAELRPDQNNQDSLPEYDILDAILQHYVGEHPSKAEIIKRGFAPAVVTCVVNKITCTEYKRRQAAPEAKISPRAFGMSCRILVAQRFRTV